MKDKKIIELFNERSAKAITALNYKYGAYIYTVSKNILIHHEDIEEVVNDTYHKVWASIPPIVPTSLKSYVAKISRNLSLDKYRRMHSKKRANMLFTGVLDELAEIIPDDADVEEELINKEIIKFIDEYLSTCDVNHRDMFVLRYFHAHSIKAISGKMNLSESNVKVVLLRMRKSIRDMLVRKGYEL